MAHKSAHHSPLKQALFAFLNLYWGTWPMRIIWRRRSSNRSPQPQLSALIGIGDGVPPKELTPYFGRTCFCAPSTASTHKGHCNLGGSLSHAVVATNITAFGRKLFTRNALADFILLSQFFAWPPPSQFAVRVAF